jgi:hypothetical protein
MSTHRRSSPICSDDILCKDTLTVIESNIEFPLASTILDHFQIDCAEWAINRYVLLAEEICNYRLHFPLRDFDQVRKRGELAQSPRLNGHNDGPAVLNRSDSIEYAALLDGLGCADNLESLSQSFVRSSPKIRSKTHLHSPRLDYHTPGLVHSLWKGVNNRDR